MKNSAFRFLTLLLSVIILLIPPAGCGVRTKAAGENHVSFTDAIGRDVSVEKNPERVAALLGSFADVWILSGGDIIATAEDGWEDFGLELADAVNIGGAHSPSLELLLSADPDFVIASASTASNVEMKDTLENAGIAVAYFDVDNFEDYLNMLDICTDITGRKDLYETNGLTIKAQIDKIKEKVAGGGFSEKERSVLLLRAASGSVKAKGSEGTILGEMLSDLGCINLADSDTSLLDTLSVEAVIRNEPYRIFVVTMGDDTEKAIENFNRMTDENPAWRTLEAVAGGRVHVMDRTLFNKKPNARWAESYEILSEILLADK
jgi:iron complex transport system substrate-binding protein